MHIITFYDKKIKPLVVDLQQKVFNKYFWLRRMEQHYLNDRYKKKSFKGLDFLLCSLINLFIKK